MSKVISPRESEILSNTDGYMEATLFAFTNARYFKGLFGYSEKPKGNYVAESYYRDKLAAITGGETEVKTPAGFIDILTPTHLIEVKELKSWKAAIGQVYAYGFYYPEHQKTISLFGPHASDTSEITAICSSLGIQVGFTVAVKSESGEFVEPELTNQELASFLDIILSARMGSSSEGARTFYTNLFERAHEAYLDTCSLEELQVHTAKLKGIISSLNAA